MFYRIYSEDFKEWNKQLTALVVQEFIRPSTGPWRAPALFFSNKDESLRYCVGHRALERGYTQNPDVLVLEKRASEYSRLRKNLSYFSATKIWESKTVLFYSTLGSPDNKADHNRNAIHDTTPETRSTTLGILNAVENCPR